MAAITAFSGSSAIADEKPVRLKEAPGLDKVAAHCSACHSLDYVQMNSPFLNAAGWNAEVAKMINAFGARIDEADAKIIAGYLSENYGIESSSERDKSFVEPPSSNFKSATPRVVARNRHPAAFKPTSLHNGDPWACSGINRLIFGSSCSLTGWSRSTGWAGR
jgi:hypothetical protein